MLLLFILAVSKFISDPFKISKDAKIWYPYNKVPNLTQDTNGKVTNSQLDTTNESKEVSPFPAGGHKAQINRPLIQMWIKTHRYLVCIKTPNLSMQHLLEHKNQNIKGDKVKIRTQQ